MLDTNTKYKSYEKHRNFELEAIAKLPDEETKTLNLADGLLVDVVRKKLYDNGHMIGLKESCKRDIVVDTFYDILSKLEVVPVINSTSENWGGVPSKVDLELVMKNTITNYNKYQKLLKNGIEERVARNLIIDEMNSNSDKVSTRRRNRTRKVAFLDARAKVPAKKESK